MTSTLVAIFDPFRGLICFALDFKTKVLVVTLHVRILYLHPIAIHWRCGKVKPNIDWCKNAGKCDVSAQEPFIG